MDLEFCLANDFVVWDKLIENSSQGNIFRIHYLSNRQYSFKCYLIKSKNQI